MESKKIKITLVRSKIRTSTKQKKILASLGLSKIRGEKLHDDSLAVRGMIKKINHMLKVEDV
jgi:large subunit ribosomal protein L30